MAGPGKGRSKKKPNVDKTPNKTKMLLHIQDGATQQSSPRRSARITPTSIDDTTPVHATPRKVLGHGYSLNEKATKTPQSFTFSPRRSARLTPAKAKSGVHSTASEDTSPVYDALSNTPSLLHGSNNEGTNVTSSLRCLNQIEPVVQRQSKTVATKNVPAIFQLRDEEEFEITDAARQGNESQQTEVRRALDLTTPTHGQEENSAGGSQQLEQTGSSSQHKMRGTTRCLGANKKRNSGPLCVEIDECAGRIVGADSQMLITKTGCVVRQYAHYDGSGWRKQNQDIKEEIVSNCTANSNYEAETMQKIMLKQLARHYQTNQYRLHKHFLKFPSKEDAIKHVPSDVAETDWLNLCNYFVSEEFQKVSSRNKPNRNKNRTPPTTGPVSIARIVHEMKKGGHQVSPIDRFEMAHYSKKKSQMINETAKQTLIEMREEEVSTSRTPSEICFEKLNGIPGNTKGVAVSKKQVLAVEKLEAEVQLEKKKAADAEERSVMLVEKVTAQNDELKTLKEQMEIVLAKLAELAKTQSRETVSAG